MKFSEAIQKFSTWRMFRVKGDTVKGYDYELRTFCLFLRNPDVENITIGDVMDYLNGLQQLGWKHNSFIPKCTAIKKFFEFFRLQGYRVLNEDLVPIPRKEYKIPRVIDDERYRQLIQAIPQNNDPRHVRNHAIIGLLWDTGARNGEIVSMDFGDVDSNRMRAVIKTEKSRGRRPLREIFWTHDTNESLGKWVEKLQGIHTREPEPLFVSVTGAMLGRRFTIKGVAEMLRRYSNRAKMPYVNAHSFRHHMGHDVIRKGGSASDVMNILGHATLASSSIYTMMTDHELEERYRKIKGA
jgi:integrase/recombinase XerD